MKRIKKMILLMAVLVLVLAGYVLMNRQQETASVQEETGAFALTAKTTEELSGLEWTKEEEVFSFLRKDGVWTKADSDAFPVKQDALESLSSQLLALQASRKLENVTDASIYGLAEPFFTVTAKWADGSSTVYQMGDETPFGDGYYLSLSDQSNTAYTVGSSLSSMFSKKMDDLAQMEDVPGVQDITRLTVGASLDAARREESATINASQLWYDADGRALDGMDDLTADAGAIAWAGLAQAAATDEQLTEWKLDDASATVLTMYGGEEIASILFGAADENGDYYARLPGSPMVYTVSADSVSSLLNASSDAMVSLALAQTEYNALTEAVFTAGDLIHTVTPPAEAENTGDKEAEAADAGEKAEEDPDELLWDQFKAFKASEHITGAEGGETMLTVNVTADTGISAAFTFIEYDADSYLVTDGERTMLTAADKVDQLIRTLKSMK